MKKRSVLYLTVLFTFCSTLATAQYASDQQDDGTATPPGMERRKVNNDVTLLVPKGGKFYRRNQTTYVEEGPEEYASRKFLDMDSRLKTLEATNRELLEEIRYLESKLVLQESGTDIDVSKSTQE
jgi:hypothetical protein